MFLDIFILALKNLLHNKLRSFLSILGVIIGVFTIVLVSSISKGVENIINEQLKFLNVTSIFVEPSDTVISKSKLDELDAYDVLEKSKYIASATSMTIGRGNITANNQTENFSIIGTSETFSEVMSFDVAYGKYFTKKDVTQNAKVVVVGESIVNEIFRGNYEIIGKDVYVGSSKFKIVGILKNTPSISGFSFDDAVYIPFSTSKKFVIGDTGMMALAFLANDIDSVSAAVEEIKVVLRDKHKIREGDVDDFNVYEQKTMLQAVDLIITAISFLLIGVAGIILVVSGIGIMNVMFAGVAERTKDIGISRAIGARKKDVLLQFLIESVILTLLGALIGVLLGEGLIALVNHYSEIKLVRSNFGDFFAAGFAFFVGVFFGLYPAKKATNLDVVESLK